MAYPTTWAQKHTLTSRRYALLFAALISLVLAACGGGGGGSSDSASPAPPAPPPAPVTLSADVYPLAAGDRRTWRVSSGSQTGGLRSERAGEAVQLDGQAAWPVRSEDGEVEYIARTATGVLSVPGAGADALTKALGPIELLRFGQVAGSTVELLKRTLTIDLDGDGRADSVDILVESSFSGYESVTTAAGNFPAAARLLTVARITTRVTGNANIGSLIVSAEEWFAPGIGPVRSVTTTTSTAQPTETETAELLAYGIGSKRSETVAPTLLSSNLAPDSVLPSAPANIELNFSEALDPLTLDSSAGLTLVDSAGQLLPIGRTLADGGKRVTITPLAALPDGRYELRLGSGLTDLANNPLAPSMRAFSVDSKRPRIISSTPADGSDEAAISGNVVLNFNEAIFTPDGSNKAAIFLSDFNGGEWLTGEIQGSSIVLRLEKTLIRNREYTVNVGTELKDAAGNVSPFDGHVIRFKTGPGPFARPTPLMDKAWVTAVAVGDINGDGRPDIVFSGAQNITAYEMFIGARLQQVDGSYAPAIRLYQAPPYTMFLTNELTLADVNGDGRMDIVMNFSNGVTALMQQATGEFVSEVIDANAWTSPNGALDLDGDGRKEIVTLNGRELRLMRRDPSGGWRVTLALGGGSQYIYSFRMADLNGDGQQDLVWLREGVTNSNFEIVWALRQGGGFGPVRSQATAPEIKGTTSWVLADVNGDGRPDLLLLQPRSSNSQIAVLAQTAAGDFALPVWYPSNGTSALDAVDINADGRIDVLSTNGTGSHLGVLLQAPDGSLEPERPFAINYTSNGNGSLVAVDINADGRIDIVTGNDVLLGRPVSGVWPAAAQDSPRRLSLGSWAEPASAKANLLAAPSQTRARGKNWLKQLRSPGLERAAVIGRLGQ
ncbi:FG-GAP-like repeat-containing protein [Paucibacter sp. B2R-40]|uniref:FG-GAP-like repeat-containing protein n=1 Tax=Paucibacter sp. B2R-40 TaxID=2893554 RepID=UPI0021E41550|nr:FG-GAP-like repeat-containing protein [Paucibacter sp. B2R-40]MCV2352877.1 FG-GAP-like repeat-containing protein [Paucibacter sp. B2R-40]